MALKIVLKNKKCFHKDTAKWNETGFREYL